MGFLFDDLGAPDDADAVEAGRGASRRCQAVQDDERSGVVHVRRQGKIPTAREPSMPFAQAEREDLERAEVDVDRGCAVLCERTARAGDRAL